jgi:hypothetical protein
METSQPAVTFPPTLEGVPQAEQIAQCFGWLYGYFGVLAIVAAIGAAFGGLWKEFSGDWTVLGLMIALTLAGPILLWWEFRRRATRTVLVPRGSVIGIYQRRKFVQTMRPEEMTVVRLNRTKSIRAAVGLPLCAAVFITIGLIDRNNWPWAVIGILILIGCISGLRTRFMFEHCNIPVGKYGKDLMIDKARKRRLE